MTQADIINYINNLKRNVEECGTDSVIAAGTAVGSNVGAFMKNEIDEETFKKNASDIAILAIDYMQKCKCERINL